MSMICPICAEHVGAHSFDEIDPDQAGDRHFYTRPSAAKRYRDRDGILRHFRAQLRQITCEGVPWVWTFDGSGFGPEHVDLRLTYGLANMLMGCRLLQEIRIINSNVLIRGLVRVLRPVLPGRLLGLLRFC